MTYYEIKISIKTASIRQFFLLLVFLVITTLLYVVSKEKNPNVIRVIDIAPIDGDKIQNLKNESIIYYDVIDFEGFDNQIGSKHYIVPNIVHLVYLNLNQISFYQAINIYSIFLNHKPEKIFIHCNNCTFTGYYWGQINSIKQLKDILILNNVPDNNKIFGKEAGWIQHRADILRIMILMNFGGIYLDNDVYVVHSLDKYRKYEIALSWDGDTEAIGNQVLIANRNARLLRAYFDSYRTSYDSEKWYWNAGQVPANILLKDRYLAHAVKIKLGSHMLVNELYFSYWSDWKNLDTIHLLMGHRSYLDKDSPIKEFDQDNIQTYNFTYGEMCRTILNNIKPYLTRSDEKN